MKKHSMEELPVILAMTSAMTNVEYIFSKDTENIFGEMLLPETKYIIVASFSRPLRKSNFTDKISTEFYILHILNKENILGG